MYPEEAKRMSVEVGSIAIGQGQSYGIRRLSYHYAYDHFYKWSMQIHPNDVGVITVSYSKTRFTK